MSTRSLARIVAAIVAAATLSACFSLYLSSEIRQPTATIVAVEIERLSFEDASLRLDVRIINPNAVRMELVALEYTLVIEGVELVKADVDRRVVFRASDSAVVPVPVTFRYDALRSVVRALAQDESPYELTIGLTFRLPVLDKVKVAATHKGTLPVVRLPDVRVASLRLQGLTLQAADLVVGLEVTNPNGFGLSLSSLDYRFAVGAESWVTGTARPAVQIGSRQKGRVDIPVKLDFGAMGRSVLDTLLGKAPLTYALSANLTVGTTLPQLQSATLPVEMSGNIGLMQ